MLERDIYVSLLLFEGEHMAREFTNGFYTSREWFKCRAAFIKSRQAIDGGICQRCGKEPGVIVHHKKHITPQNIDDPNITLNHDNLEYVCHSCHDIIHGNKQAIPEGMVRYEFGPDGQPVVRG